MAADEGKSLRVLYVDYDDLTSTEVMIMPKRLLAASIGLVLGALSCSVAHAQVDKVLVHVVSWVLQKQIDELDKANDPNRELSEYNAGNKFDALDQYAPREQPKYQDLPAYRGYNREENAGRPEGIQTVGPATQ
ncbi:MAG: hypothetical protein HYU74_02065 [Dechloromonas sp.]|nr:hypothetical protein [Dechloromonas sp.]